MFGFYFCFNVDTKFPIVFSGDKSSYFGFSVELHQNEAGSSVLITAPKANSSRSELHRPGVLYKCNITTIDCQEISLYKPKNINSLFYKEVKDDMMLGISLDVQQNGGNVVTCGHLWKNHYPKRKHYLTNGVCYMIDGSFNTAKVEKLLPIVQNNKQAVGSPLLNYYAYGMAGFSVTYTEDGKDLLLGSPGILEGTGSVIDYKIRSGARFNHSATIIPNPNATEELLKWDSYLGYSITSGKFFKHRGTSVVAGAPRAGDDYGCVYILQELNEKNGKLVIQEKKTGEQIGGYFGYAVLGLNVNSDEYTDLLIGEPFYSTAHSGDEGRVYVYLSNGTELRRQEEKLKGSMNPNARFGIAIVAIGDINFDGFLDVAIGAPYDNDFGAIYIYHGSEKGIKEQFIQKITPEDLHLNLLGFGMSISKGKDIDGNSYPDILIGAYESNQAVLLRSQPIIFVQPRFNFYTKQIKINSTTCGFNGLEEGCFDLRYCLTYSGSFVPEKVDLVITLDVDIYRIHAPRVYFNEENQPSSKMISEVIAQHNTDNCYDTKVFVKEDIRDIVTPIKFLLTYSLKSLNLSEFCKACPLLDPTTPNTTTSEIVFQTECGDDNECLSDLKLNILVNIRDEEPLIIGRDTTLIIDVLVENVGEPAYVAVVNVSLPENVEVINQADCTSYNEEHFNVTLSCDIGNPLYTNQIEEFQLKLDISKIRNSLSKLEVLISAETISKETNPTDNYMALTIPVVAKANIYIKGSADNEVIFLTDKMQDLIPIIHTFVISKDMSSPITLVDVMISVPAKLPNDEALFLENLTLHEENNKINEMVVSCNGTDMAYENTTNSKQAQDGAITARKFTPAGHPDHSGFDTVVLDCSTVLCKTFRCSIGPFLDNQRMATFQIMGYINLKTLQKAVGKRDVMAIVSQGMVEIRDENVESSQRKAFTKVSTALEKPGLHIATANTSWIVIVSVIAGLILLILLVLLLMKLGFFRRKEQEEMKKLAKEEQIENKEEVESDTNIELEESEPSGYHRI